MTKTETEKSVLSLEMVLWNDHGLSGVQSVQVSQRHSGMPAHIIWLLGLLMDVFKPFANDQQVDSADRQHSSKNNQDPVV